MAKKLKKSRARGKVKRGGRRTAKAKAAARSQARPERGKIHYLLRNIPKATWQRFKDSRPDARFDLLTHINAEVAKLEPVAAPVLEVEPAAEVSPIVVEPAGIEAPGEETPANAVNQ